MCGSPSYPHKPSPTSAIWWRTAGEGHAGYGQQPISKKEVRGSGNPAPTLADEGVGRRGMRGIEIPALSLDERGKAGTLAKGTQGQRAGRASSGGVLATPPEERQPIVGVQRDPVSRIPRRGGAGCGRRRYRTTEVRGSGDPGLTLADIKARRAEKLGGVTTTPPKNFSTLAEQGVDKRLADLDRRSLVLRSPHGDTARPARCIARTGEH